MKTKMEFERLEAHMRTINNEIRKAVEENDIRKTEFYHLFAQLIQTNYLIKTLKRLNTNNLGEILNYMEEKENYVLSELEKFNVNVV